MIWRLFSVEVLQVDVTEGDSECSAPDGELLDVEDGGLLRGQDKDDVLTRDEPLEVDLRLQVGPEESVRR